MSVILIILAVILFVSLVVVHEFGHFIAARRNGVEVEEFGIGFPPRAWVKRVKSKKGDYDFSLNWLPLGGFVKLKGEHDADEEPGTFGAASLGAKVKIMLAGVFMNLVTAFVMLTLLALIGMPKVIPDQFTVERDTTVIQEVQNKGVVTATDIQEDSPAARAGIQDGDRLVSVAGEEINSPFELPEITQSREVGETVEVIIERNGEERAISVELGVHPTMEDTAYLGVAPQSQEEGLQLQRSTWSAPVVAAGLIKQITVETFRALGVSLGALTRGDTAVASQQVTGPVGIFHLFTVGSSLGLLFILFIIAIISLALAIMNILPIPALDGGRLYVTLLFRAIKKPLTPELEEKIHGTGFLLLMVLFVLITIVDVKRIF